MLKRPRIKRFLTVFPLDETRWVFRGGVNELSRVELRNERARNTFQRMLPLLDGSRTTEEILDRLEGQGVDRRASEILLGHLESSRCLEEADGRAADGEANGHGTQPRFFSHFSADAGVGHQRLLSDSRVVLLADGPLAGPIERQLGATGIGGVSRLPVAGAASALSAASDPEAGERAPDVLVVAPERHDPELLGAIDEVAKKRRLPWLLVRLASLREAWIGPLFVPGETASYRSLEVWQRGGSPFFAFPPSAERRGVAVDGTVPIPPPAAVLEVVAGIAVTEIVKLRTLYQVPHLLGRFLAVDLLSWEVQSHDVWRIPALDRSEAPKPTAFPWKDALYGKTGTHDRRG